MRLTSPSFVGPDRASARRRSGGRSATIGTARATRLAGALVTVVVLALASACGSTTDAPTDAGAGSPSGSTVASTSTTEAPIVPATTDPSGTTRFNVYWLRTCPSPEVATAVGDCRIAVGESRTTTDPDILTAAMEALNGGPNEAERAAGLSSNIRSISDFYGVRVEDGVAVVDYNRYFETAATRPQVAQVVYTLTQFPTIAGVRFEVDHAPNGATGTRPAGRGDVLELAPPVLVESPALGGVVGPTFAVAGTLAAPDVTFSTRVVALDGTALAESAGAAIPGESLAPVPFLQRVTTTPDTAGAVVLVITASDGTEVTVPILVQ